MDQDGGSPKVPQHGGDMVHAVFLQRAVDALEHLFGSSIGERLAARLRGDALQLFLSSAVSVSTANLRTGVYSEEQRQSAPTRVRDASRFVDLDDASGLLLAIDAALGDGSGSTLERVGQALGAHTFIDFQRARDHAEHADVATWTRRLTTALLASFPEDCVVWKAVERSDGLEIVFHVPGHARAARVLRHLTVGQLRAAFTFAMEATSADLRVLAESLGDRFTLTARYRTAAPPLSEYSTPPSSIRPTAQSSPPIGQPHSLLPSSLLPSSLLPSSLLPSSLPPSSLLQSNLLQSGYPPAQSTFGSSWPLDEASGSSSWPPPQRRSGPPRTSVSEHVNEILRRIPKRR